MNTRRLPSIARMHNKAVLQEGPITWGNVSHILADARVVARRLLRKEYARHSLQTTALLLSGLRRQKLNGQAWDEVAWEDRESFLAAMYRAMERALIDHGRRRMAQKRQAAQLIDVDELNETELLRFAEFQPHELQVAFEQRPEVVTALTAALALLERRHPDWACVARHRYYAGLTIDEIARIMGIAERTVRRHWEKARVLLHDEILRALRERDHHLEAD